MPLSESRITIVGLGLMGGSLALALRGRCARMVGVDRDPVAVELARGAVDFSTPDLASGLRDCNLIVLATPVRSILSLLSALQSLIPDPQPPTSNLRLPISVLDLGSTKASIVSAMDSLPPPFDPIGGHPMCGREVAGFAHADADLYRGRTFVLVPLARTSKRTRVLAGELVAAIGANAVELAAARHDALTAITSHLPYAAAVALMQAALSSNDDRLWDMTASGFRDTSRLAASDPTMMVDILITNRAAILDALARYRAELDSLIALIDRADPEALSDAVSPAQAKRSRMFK
ncbi:MAG: prephenate dehydrogenase/arogenate dehydrogenase family protein [Chloroflexi bacterium]|nr:prephenate dehydrogenase/arogenate dehydrogenase family protein [Chloroflexota bacterium]